MTLNTLMQAAWGVLLGRLTGRDDVVFGVTVAGRPPELAGVEQMVGLFINTLPLRMRLRRRRHARRSCCGAPRPASRRLLAHQHLGLERDPAGRGLGDLFDTLLVFENYPVDRDGPCRAGRRACGSARVEGRDATHYPLTLLVQPGERCSCGSTIGPTCSSAAGRGVWRRRLIRLLEAAAARRRTARSARCRSCDATERDTILRVWNDTAQAGRRRADVAGAVCRAGRAHAGRGRRWCSRTAR